MSNRIAVLPPNLANQIAAGEVVERPSSVVKELVENALDAASREARIETEEGGLRLIRVSDDGEGMGPEDARTAFERHATSKIHSAADLHAVASYGFRGEALPSIASVSRVRLITRREEDAVGTEIRITGGVLGSCAETGAPRGTLVEIADLFFNTPARRKFLRRPAVEAARITDVLSRLALARPDVGFTLVQGGRVVLDARAGVPLTERIVEVLGGASASDLLPVAGSAGAVTVQGLISPPDRTQPTARALHLFVNERPIRDRALQHALISAARDFIPPDRFPLAALHLKIPPDSVDENVHPAKLEVRFRDARAVYEAVRRAVLDAYRGWSPLGVTAGPAAPAAETGRTAPGAGAEAVQESLAPYPGAADTGDAAVAGGEAGPTETEVRPRAGSAPARFLGQAHETYLLFESAEGILVLDQHAAHERLVFERIRHQVETGGIAKQPLLVTRTIELSPARRNTLQARGDEIAKMGFEIAPFGGNTVAIKASPAMLGKVDLQALLEHVADDLAEEGGTDALARAFRSALATIACHASVRAGQHLERRQAEALLSEIAETGGTGTCPHGRPVAIRFPRADLERLFRRT